MKLLCAFASAAVVSSASDVSAKDLQRAKSKVPGSFVRGSSFSQANDKLNLALKRSAAAPILADCGEFSTAELQETMAVLIEAGNAELRQIYDSSNDARGLRHDSLAGYQEEWSVMAKAASNPKLALAAHDMLCHEAVMLFVHHLAAEQQHTLVAEGKVLLPTLPVGERLFADRANVGMVVDAYLKSTGCVACHTDVDGLTPDVPFAEDTPRWPPAAEPVMPWRFSANLGGWMMMGPQRTDFTGSFHYDYTLNRLKEHWVVTGQGMEIINYWFGSQAPDKESAQDMPAGAARGHIYQVMQMGGQILSCRDDQYPTFSVVRPDAFIKQWHNGNEAKNLHWVARENMDVADVGGATGWADHWTYANSCGNFSLWNSIETGLPVYTRGPTGCNSGDAGNSYVNHTLGPPEASLFEFNFSMCKPKESAALHQPLWGAPTAGFSFSVV